MAEPSATEQDVPQGGAPVSAWRSEDWMAVWLGAFLVLLTLIGVRIDLPKLEWDSLSGLGDILGGEALWKWLLGGAAYLVLSAAGIGLMGGNVARYATGFPVVFLLAFVALVIAGNTAVSDIGLEFVLFALFIGLAISNLVGVPDWLAEAVRTEYYIKTGLVVLGAGILFPDILDAGARGLVQALLVATVVWYVCFWLARRFRVDDEFAVMLSSAVAICGVSAAIATCGAIGGDRRKLSYVTSLVLLVAVPMLVVMPWVVKTLGIPEVVGGAWLGGTLDTSGSVVAAAELISESALKAGVIVKFSQNVLIGVAAFVLSVWWTMRKREGVERPSPRVIWERFPKFVLGFLAASLLFSFVVSEATVAETKGILTNVRTMW
ncbi:MAG: putative sulfate exporter family transporter, partial [Actinomycetota bacterium]|nr:putative sulfate exporter family transporter [Actinomycetota bacterium]